MSNTIDVFSIIHKRYDSNSLAYKVLLQHSICVTKKALEIANTYENNEVDKKFVYEAAMLHDIGIIKVDSEEIGCFGSNKYIEHGYLGREMLESIGLPKHGLVCERHTGVGITKESIIEQGLPIPKRGMIPISLEEKIISYADLFFSKNPTSLLYENTKDNIKKGLSKFGQEKVKISEEWNSEFSAL